MPTISPKLALGWLGSFDDSQLATRNPGDNSTFSDSDAWHRRNAILYDFHDLHATNDMGWWTRRPSPRWNYLFYSDLWLYGIPAIALLIAGPFGYKSVRRIRLQEEGREKHALAKVNEMGDTE